ncbi:MAG: hypothetical protein U0638_15720 [Phycisphaerales bacterium]
MHQSILPSLAAALAVCSIAVPALAQHDHSLIQAGRDESGMLHMHTHDAMPFEVMPSAFAGIDGFATAEVAFESLSADHPAIGLFMLDEASDLRAVLVAQDHGIQVFGGGPDPLPIGGEVYLGHPFFHVMPVYNIYDGKVGDEFSMWFRFTDVSGMYTESQPFELRFVAVPAPAGVASFLMLGLGAMRRRR